MSYFRSAEEVSDSSASQNVPTGKLDDEDYSISRVRSIGPGTANEHRHGLGSSDAFSPSSAPASFHANVLLHSLIEERCLDQALAELKANGRPVDSIDHPEVRALGSIKYSRTIMNLSNLNIVQPGLDSNYYAPVRQDYRSAVDLLGGQNAAASRPGIHRAASQIALHLPQSLRQYHGPRNSEDVRRQLGMMTVAETQRDPFITSSHQLMETKYAREFDEYSMLGKGGYGVVFHVRNKLDGGDYAIKKIPMSDRRLRRIQEHGQVEMDTILVELRTLAKLNHPNVVRYHTGWIEYANFSTRDTPNRAVGQKLLELPEESSGAQANDQSIGFQFDFEDDSDSSASGNVGASSAGVSDIDIVFEDSSEDSKVVDPPSASLSIQMPPFADNELQKMRSQGTLASVEDEEVEIIPRDGDLTTTSQMESSGFTDSGETERAPCLALHIQMSLYSMTLADFLSSSEGGLDSSAITSLRHCFHPSASLSILMAIMNGVKYLHQEGIVHRDLKPGNIFLAVRPGSDSRPGSINLSSCSSCARKAAPRPFNMDICLGDFGLVSAIAKEDEVPVAPSRIVGTEIYRPESVTRDNHASLDVYALGIIAFELVWRFGTRMERHETIHGLKKEKFPDDFDEKVDCAGLKSFIESMVLACEKKCPSWDDLMNTAEELKAGLKA